jgi:hypothetical protein
MTQGIAPTPRETIYPDSSPCLGRKQTMRNGAPTKAQNKKAMKIQRFNETF